MRIVPVSRPIASSGDAMLIPLLANEIIIGYSFRELVVSASRTKAYVRVDYAGPTDGEVYITLDAGETDNQGVRFGPINLPTIQGYRLRAVVYNAPAAGNCEFAAILASPGEALNRAVHGGFRALPFGIPRLKQVVGGAGVQNVDFQPPVGVLWLVWDLSGYHNDVAAITFQWFWTNGVITQAKSGGSVLPATNWLFALDANLKQQEPYLISNVVYPSLHSTLGAGKIITIGGYVQEFPDCGA